MRFRELPFEVVQQQLVPHASRVLTTMRQHFIVGTHNVAIFQMEEGLRDQLCDDECVEVDSGYQGNNKFQMKDPIDQSSILTVKISI